MKYLRFWLIIASAFFISSTQAQLSAFINGKEIKANANVTKEDLKTLEVSFKSPKLPSFIYGKSFLTVYINDAKNSYIEYWSLQKDGSAAVEDFLKNTPVKKKFKVFDGDLNKGGNDLDWVLVSSPGREDRKTLQIKIVLTYREKTGYEEYGQSIALGN